MFEEIKKGNLNKTIKNGKLKHHHIQFIERENSLFWKLKSGQKQINDLFHRPRREEE